MALLTRFICAYSRTVCDLCPQGRTEAAAAGVSLLCCRSLLGAVLVRLDSHPSVCQVVC